MGAAEGYTNKEGNPQYAVSRRTRTPITFDPRNSKAGGEYFPPSTDSPIAKLISYFGLTPPQSLPSSGIFIYPNSPNIGNIKNTIKHEDIHALLESIGNPSPTNISSYTPIANRIMQYRAGIPENEVPAYMGVFDKNVTPDIPIDIRNSFVSDFTKLLMAKKAEAARIYQLLSGGTGGTGGTK